MTKEILTSENLIEIHDNLNEFAKHHQNIGWEKALKLKWIDKNDRMPNKHPEFEGCTKDVMVTDGESWGYGRYYYEDRHWTYRLVGYTESDDNDITHWAEPPILPNVKNENKCSI